jgi:acetyltransferase
VIALGAGADVNFGEILDYLVFDQETAHILLYVEGIRDARRFMSSLRAAARTKPIVVLKAGRFDAGSKAAASHTGVLSGSDAVFAAALKRSGTVRVKTYTQLFAAARILASGRSAQGNRLAIITNGGGPGVMAADAATESGVALAGLTAITRKQLDAVLPPNWSHRNPIDIIGDATCERFVETLKAVVEDPNVDGILTLFCPQRMTRAKDAAQAVIPIGQESTKPFLTAWLGDAEVAECRALFESAGIPNFYTPENAVEAFAFLAAFRRNQTLLLETAPPLSILPPLPPADVAIANDLREKLVAEGRTVMTELESKMLLRSFHIPAPEHVIARSKEAAIDAAARIGYPVVIKVQSADIKHKSDVGGVRLNLQNRRMLETAYDDMLAQIKDIQPDARIEGVAVQPMLRYSHAREVRVGLSTDLVFGPVVMFGLGGVAGEALGDTAVALPPLNRRLAAELIDETHIARLLKSYHGFRSVDFSALETLLLRVSALACQLPWVKEMDLNPVLAHPGGAMVADARIVIDPARESGVRRYHHMAIHPYPAELESTVTLKGGERLQVRPIKPDDAQMEQAFVATLSDDSRYMRFLHHLTELSPIMLARFTQIDYDREMALIALAETNGSHAIVGVARYHPNPDRVSAEFAVTVTDSWQGRGLGHVLMQKMLECARDAGYDSLVGTVLSLNSPMLQMTRSLGFVTVPLDGGQTLRVLKSLK